MKFNGYQEAAVIDKLINELLSKNPITLNNAMQWMRFTRTIATGVNFLNNCAQKEWTEGMDIKS